MRCRLKKIRKNHMDILWHEYTDKGGEEIPVTQASLTEKASIVGRVGIMLLSCGTGAWRVRRLKFFDLFIIICIKFITSFFRYRIEHQPI